MRKRWIWCLVALLLGWQTAATAQDFESIELSTEELTASVAVVSGGGGNIGVLHGPDGVLLIDTQFAPLESKIRDAVVRLSDRPVRFVVNTHWHFDHVGCNECFADGAVIIGPEGTRARMASEQDFPMLGSRSPAFAAQALPKVEITDTATLFFDGERIDLVHVPGAHSGHDLVVVLRGANVMHAGDLYWSRGYPYIGTPHGGSVDGLIAAADRLLGLADENTMIIPGHGPVTDRSGLEAYRNLLVSTRDTIAELIADGRSVQEIVESRPTAETDDLRRMGMPPEVFVRLVHRDLVGEGG